MPTQKTIEHLQWVLFSGVAVAFHVPLQDGENVAVVGCAWALTGLSRQRRAAASELANQAQSKTSNKAGLLTTHCSLLCKAKLPQANSVLGDCLPHQRVRRRDCRDNFRGCIRSHLAPQDLAALLIQLPKLLREACAIRRLRVLCAEEFAQVSVLVEALLILGLCLFGHQTHHVLEELVEVYLASSHGHAAETSNFGTPGSIAAESSGPLVHCLCWAKHQHAGITNLGRRLHSRP